MLLNRIKERGKEFDMSLQDIAEATHISPNTIYSWRVKTPRTDKLKQVAMDMPYGGSVPDELKDYYKALAEQYIKQHPEILKKRDEK